MRSISIFIDRRPNTEDNQYFFTSEGQNFFTHPVYAFVNLTLNYAIINSSVTSLLVLGMNQPQSSANVLRSGQPVTITDNGVTVFQGVILTAKYQLFPIGENGRGGGLYLLVTLAPSLFQLTITPMIFDADQAKQVQQITGVNTSALLVGVTQSANTTAFLDYMVSNTDYANYFQRSISASDLDSNLYVMAEAGQYRDPVLRQSIDYYNCVLYQQEDGTIVIRQLDPSIESPFDVDLSNSYLGNQGNPDSITVAPLLAYEYIDDAYSTPSVISNYCMISPNISISGNADTAVLSYAPNPKFFPRLQQLAQSGWFTGQIGGTQLGENIVNNPTTAAALAKFQAYQDQYMISTQATGVKDQKLAAYQALLTAKQMGQALTGYAGVMGTISLDDKNLQGTDLSKVVGTCLQIQNCDLQSGLIAACSRNYSVGGSFLTFTAVPLGSYTGYWKNSTFVPEEA